MQTEIRFTCPECGQHYTAEAGWQDVLFTCSTCKAQFEVRPLPAAAGPEAIPPATRIRQGRLAAIPVSPGRDGPYRLLGTSYALVTPPALAIIAWLCVSLLRFLGGLGKVLGIAIAGTIIAYISNRFSKWYLAQWGSDAFEYYRKSTYTAFLFLPGAAVVIFLARGEEGAGLVLFPVTLGLYFFSIMLAAAWLIGAKWLGPGR